MFPVIPSGFDDPCTCNAMKCIHTKAANINGSRKCNAKNLWIVGLLTLNPPHINGTMSSPINGIADNRFVITVAPQCDICPYTQQYPMKAIAIVSINIITPTTHTMTLGAL